MTMAANTQPICIAYDLQQFRSPKAGIYRYAMNLVSGMRKRSDTELYFVDPHLSDNALPKELSWSAKENRRTNYAPLASYQIYPWRKNDERNILQRTANRTWRTGMAGLDSVFHPYLIERNLSPKPDVYHYSMSWTPRLESIASVATVHDLLPLTHPEWFKAEWLPQIERTLKFFARHADRIICVSEQTRLEFIRHFKVAPERVRTVYHCAADHFYPQKDKQALAALLASLGIERDADFILSVGTLEPRKNLIGLIRALEILHKKGKLGKTQLLAVGQKGWNYHETLRVIENSSIAERITLADFISDNDLRLLYSHAAFLGFMSHYEGFGSPAVEAAACKCPLLLSSAPTLPEIMGDAALYANPDKPEDIADKAALLLEDSKLRNDLAIRAQKHAQSYSFEHMIEETLAVYKELA